MVVHHHLNFKTWNWWILRNKLNRGGRGLKVSKGTHMAVLNCSRAQGPYHHGSHSQPVWYGPCKLYTISEYGFSQAVCQSVLPPASSNLQWCHPRCISPAPSFPAYRSAPPQSWFLPPSAVYYSLCQSSSQAPLPPSPRTSVSPSRRDCGLRMYTHASTEPQT